MNAALNHDRCAIIHGRSLETMRSVFADKSVDLILTDPPYSAHVHANLGKEGRNDGVASREPLQFPALTNDDVHQLAQEFVRISRGWILVCTDQYLSLEWGRAIDAAGGRHMRTGAWVKTNPMPQMSGDRPAAGHEDIVIGWAGDKRSVWNGGGHAALWRGGREHGAVHPNQKPLWLVQELLGAFAQPGATVLDPFFGSGTTAAAALLKERVKGKYPLETTCPKCAKKIAEEWAPPLPQDLRVFGIEGDPKWVAHACARITPLLCAL